MVSHIYRLYIMSMTFASFYIFVKNILIFHYKQGIKKALGNVFSKNSFHFNVTNFKLLV